MALTNSSGCGQAQGGVAVRAASASALPFQGRRQAESDGGFPLPQQAPTSAPPSTHSSNRPPLPQLKKVSVIDEETSMPSAPASASAVTSVGAARGGSLGGSGAQDPFTRRSSGGGVPSQGSGALGSSVHAEHVPPSRKHSHPHDYHLHGSGHEVLPSAVADRERRQWVEDLRDVSAGERGRRRGGGEGIQILGKRGLARRLSLTVFHRSSFIPPSLLKPWTAVPPALSGSWPHTPRCQSSSNQMIRLPSSWP